MEGETLFSFLDFRVLPLTSWLSRRTERSLRGFSNVKKKTILVDSKRSRSEDGESTRTRFLKKRRVGDRGEFANRRKKTKNANRRKNAISTVARLKGPANLFAERRRKSRGV